MVVKCNIYNQAVINITRTICYITDNGREM
jgi:hypothetical protein